VGLTVQVPSSGSLSVKKTHWLLQPHQVDRTCSPYGWSTEYTRARLVSPMGLILGSSARCFTSFPVCSLRPGLAGSLTCKEPARPKRRGHPKGLTTPSALIS
jgi:hypothetical protein